MKILLNGYFYTNLGDDLFFHLITQRYPRHTFYVPVHADHAATYSGYSNVKLLPQTKLHRGLNKLLSKVSDKLSLNQRLSDRTDLSVLIGGSMFQEQGSDCLQRLARFPRHPGGQYVLGVSFGPHKTQTYVDACRKYLAGVTDVCFRDCVSYSYFQELPNARLGSDMVFGIQALCPAASEKQNTCVISLMDFAAKEALAPYTQDYYDFLIKTVRQQVQLGRNIILVSFCRFEGDESATGQFLSRCPQELHPHISVLHYDGKNWKQVCHCISSAACLVASRFHSVVLGLAYGVPTIPISYSNKTLQLLQDLGLQDAAITPQLLAQAQPQAVIAENLSQLQAGAEAHFAILDHILK